MNKIFQLFDNSLKKACSYALRLALGVGVAFVILVFPGLYLPPWTLIFVFAYWSGFVFLRGKFDSHLGRGLLDLVFLATVLFLSDAPLLVKSSLFFLLLIDYPNAGSSTKRFFENLSYYVAFTIAELIAFHGEFWSFVFGINLAYFGIIQLFHTRSHYASIPHLIEGETVSFFENLSSIGNQDPNSLLANLIDKVNFYLGDRIDQIYCFSIGGESTRIVGSTEFVVNFRIERGRDATVGAAPPEISDVYIEGNRLSAFRAMSVQSKNLDLLFIIALNTKLSDLNGILLEKYVGKALIFIARVISMDLSFHKRNLGMQAAYAEKSALLNDIYGSIHFLKNHLGPVVFYMNAANRFYREGAKNDIDQKYLREEAAAVDAKLLEITTYSLAVLEKAKIAVRELKTEIAGYQKFVSVLRENWYQWFEDEPPIKFPKPVSDTEEKRVFEVQHETLYLIFDNVISNMKKYALRVNPIEIDFRGDSIYLTFSNECELSHHETFVSIAKSVNSKAHSDELIRSRHSGIHSLLTYAEKLNCVVRMKTFQKPASCSVELQFRETTKKVSNEKDSGN